MPDDAAYVAELRDVAERAVTAWPLDVATIELISLSENAVFRIDATDGARYALRIHRPGYNSLPELESELLWTEALREAGIDVSAAVRTDDAQRDRTGDSLQREWQQPARFVESEREGRRWNDDGDLVGPKAETDVRKRQGFAK